MLKNCRNSLAILFLCFSFVCPEIAASQELVLGASSAQSGTSGKLGREYARGFQAYFAHVNQNGGVNGRKIVLKIRDDGYEPGRARANTRRFVTDDVLLLTGYVGTPTAKAALPVAEDAGLPFFFPMTGAEFLRHPVRPLVFNLRASYFMETEMMVRYLVDNLALNRIAVFYQADSFGQAGLAGVQRAMKKRGMKLEGSASYARNTIAVKGAVEKLARLKPEAVIMIGTYKPCVRFIQIAKRSGMANCLFLNISFVGSAALAHYLGKDGDGVMISQVVPSPWNMDLPAVQEYHAVMKARFNDFKPGYLSFEGFLAAKTLVEILNRAGPEPDRKSVLQAANSLRDYDPGIGTYISFSAKDHQGLDKVFLVKIQKGRFVPVRF